MATVDESTICERCGREIKRLNPASDTPKCVGCGLPPEVCTCHAPAD